MTHQPLTRAQWLHLTNETAIDPSRPLCDPHHHLWDRPNNRYLAEELLADLQTGHNIVSTVFIECGAGYLSQGPEALRPIGETQFALREANRAADLGATTKVAAGIVSFADLTLGENVTGVLEAHRQAGNGRFRGIRHCVATDSDDNVPSHRIEPASGLLGEASFREGFSLLQSFDLSFEAWLYHPQLPELIKLAKDFPESCRRSLGHRALRKRSSQRRFRMARFTRRAFSVSQCRCKAWWSRYGDLRIWVGKQGTAPLFSIVRRTRRSIYPPLHRLFWYAACCV